MNEITARAVDGIQHRVGASSWLVEMSWAVGALAIVVVLGGLKVYTPLDGDQALFLYTAQSIDAGGVLYIDVWDLKQPGIFWFYWAAGKVFGFTTVGVRLFELIWLLSLAASLISCLRRYFTHPWMGSVAAVAGIGSYYAFADAQELTQIEMLVALPMFLAACLLVRTYRSSAGRLTGYLIAGGLSAVCVLFKLPYAPIFVFLVLLAILDTAPGRGAAALGCHAFAVLLPYTAGVAAVLGAGCRLPDPLPAGRLDVLPFLSLGDAPAEAPFGRLVRSRQRCCPWCWLCRQLQRS